ncbi:MAG TPA: acyltransferase [Anaerolineae bacterium]|nr:acyltransferase [Anaerolineae bacterium]
MKRNRIQELDFLRSLAVLLLLVHHSGVYQYQIGSFPLITLSKYINHLLLGAFVFISGYLTSITLYQRKITDLPTFYLSRLIRLYIPYLVALFLFIFLLEIQIPSRELIIQVLGLQILLSPRYSDPVLTLWFISLLIIFLSITPILIVSIKKIARLFTAYLIVFIISILIHNGFEIIDLRFIYLFPTFAIGSLIGGAQGLPAMRTSNWLLIGSFIGLILGIYMLSFSDRHYIPDLDLRHVFWSTLYILSSIILIFRVTPLFLHFRITQKLVLFIAIGSYFTYLYHRPLWRILNNIFGIQGGEIEALVNLISTPLVLSFTIILQNLYGKFLLRR